MNDPLEALKRAAGIPLDAPKVEVGPASTSTWEEIRQEYRERMEMLARGGYDYAGLDIIGPALRRS